ncbi:MAG: RNA ligase family protein [Candidatus Dojkabacteria bacterium]|nr:RNA ligase family protein [Candidatus Dojkabacteria bacterium]
MSFSKYALFKYPRTYHLPFSQGISLDDNPLVMESIHELLNNEIVITEKYDGENTNLYKDYIHSRSLDYKRHWSRDLIKSFHASISSKIPENLRICGENLVGVHSIKYTNLPHYFLGFSVWEGDLCYSWDDTLKIFDEVGIKPVRQIYRGKSTLDNLINIAKKIDSTKCEGYVVRVTKKFLLNDFPYCVGKWVSRSFINSNKNWHCLKPEYNEWVT